jgi:hypothetical protein
MAETPQFRSVDGEAAYFLEGEPLHTGDAVELLLAHDEWLPGTYEWNGQQIRWPAFRFALGGDGPVYGAATSRTAVVALPPDAVLRRRRRR